MKSHILEDPTMIEVVEEHSGEGGLAGSPQKLHVRVGPVFDGDEQRREPGVWIEYEDSNREWNGPLLLSPATWYELARAVDRRIQRRNRFGWPRKWR